MFHKGKANNPNKNKGPIIIIKLAFFISYRHFIIYKSKNVLGGCPLLQLVKKAGSFLNQTRFLY
tara:strand:+ start:24761 stop:24952 length:192 start_codon:yes stop_codon:yes gene_type:complete